MAGKRPTPMEIFSDTFWLDYYSASDRWREGRTNEDVRQVLVLLSDDAIEDVVREIKANGLSVKKDQLRNLLRHWALIELDESKRPKDRERAKSQRKKAKELQRALRKIDKLLSDGRGALIYSLSLHLEHRLPIHHSRSLVLNLHSTAQKLLPAADAVANTDLRRGRRVDERLHLAIDSLVEIFEFTTRSRAHRTFDPVNGEEASPFSRFAERCMRLLEQNSTHAVEHTVRKVLSDRRERLK